jgi:hypothetical protein
MRSEHGQAGLLLVGALCAVLVGAVALGAVAASVSRHEDRQRAADLAALAAAGSMRDDYARLYPLDGQPGLSPASYVLRARRAALATAAANGAHSVFVRFPDATPGPPLRAVVRVAGNAATHDAPRDADATAEAEVAMPTAVGFAPGGDGEYRGPLVYRDGKPMRPDTALAYDRMAAAARAAGIDLVVVSGFRTNAEQAALFAAHPDPKWVARPGTSLHRLGTELDIGPASAYGWLAANAHRFRFVKRYAWEPWHFGYTGNPGSRSVGFGGGGESVGSALPAWVPAAYVPLFARAAQRWNVSAALLAAQARAESDFDPHSVSSAGALGISQLMPDEIHRFGVTDPFDPAQSIDVQGHLMRDLLRQFASVPLALAAYNAGPGAVAPCMCVPDYPETQAYVARILGFLRGAGDGDGLAAGFTIRLVR